MSWTLRIVQGAQLADGVATSMTLPEPLQRLSIGRDPTSQWPIADRTKAISGRHCEIVDSIAGPVLRDLSTNGTFVNGATTRMVGEHVLRDGDRIEMGPYVVMVSGPPMPPRPHEVPPTVAPGVRTAGVMDTAPLRGGDPAAMLAAGVGAEEVRLTEILRVAKPREDSGVELTKIRLATPAPARAVAPPPPPPPPPARPPAPAPEPDLVLPLVKPATSLLQALARGLGVEESALQGQDLLVLAEHLAPAAPPDKVADARRRAAAAQAAPQAGR